MAKFVNTRRDLEMASYPTIAVLGAPDPEMTRIKEVARAAGLEVVFASVNGVRCHAGNAYHADTPELSDHRLVLVVECGWQGMETSGLTIIRCDHHRPGDPGYGKPPSDFWRGSSLGQVCQHMGRPAESNDLIIAAADHCLTAAYRGECATWHYRHARRGKFHNGTGIVREPFPEAVMAWRIKSRAKFQHRSEDEVVADVNNAFAALSAAPKVVIAGVSVADLGLSTVPEAPEAACRYSIPFLAQVSDRDGKHKQVLQSAPPEVIAAWMEMYPNSYGDPQRGFAGRYL